MLSPQSFWLLLSQILQEPIFTPTHFHIYAPKLANDTYPGLVSFSYIQTIE